MFLHSHCKLLILPQTCLIVYFLSFQGVTFHLTWGTKMLPKMVSLSISGSQQSTQVWLVVLLFKAHQSMVKASIVEGKLAIFKLFFFVTYTCSGKRGSCELFFMHFRCWRTSDHQGWGKKSHIHSVVCMVAYFVHMKSRTNVGDRLRFAPQTAHKLKYEANLNQSGSV